MKKPKILFFAASAVGGAERMTINIAKSLNPIDYDVVYYVIGSKESPIVNFIPSGTNVKFIKPQSGFFVIFSILRCLLKEKPDCVFSSMMYLNTKILLLRNIFKTTKFIIRCENYLYTYSRKQMLLIRGTYYKADKIIAQTEEMKIELVNDIGIKENVVEVLQNPIDKETINKCICDKSPYKNNSIKFIASGAFKRAKGFDVLVKAFPIVLKHIPNAELYIVGDYETGNRLSIYNEVKKEIENNGIDGKIHILGYKKNPYIWMKYADCFVLSSRNEGLPNVLIEAQYIGLPVAATNCIPVISRIVNDGINGYLAENENPSSLAAAMINAVNLKNIQITYCPATYKDFENCFKN